MKRTTTVRALACVALVLPVLVLKAADAQAAGFAVRESSTTGLGNAFAGAPTSTDDISNMNINPATMGFQTGIQAVATGAYIIPNSKFKDGDASTTDFFVPSPPAPAPTTIPGVPITRNALFDGNDDIGRNALVPATFGMISITDEIKAGLNVTAPFGLLTDNPGGWIGRYHAEKSQLETFDINPTIAYRPTPYLSLGAGFRALYADAELSNAIDYGSILFSNSFGTLGTPTAQDGRAKLTGDDWGFGYNLGVMLEPGHLTPALDGLRLGVGFRSKIALKIDGETDFEDDTTGAVATIRAGAADPTLFTDTDATAELDLPESLSFGLNYDLNDEWSFMGQAEWTNWSRFDELRVKFDNPSQPDSVTDENWNDSWFFAVGTTYRPMQVQGLSLRLGFAFDQTPVPDSTRTPRVPDEDRYWVAAGVGYAPFDWLSLDLGYTHIFIPDAEIDLEATGSDTFRGNLSGEYEAGIDIVTFQGTVRF